MTRAPKPPATRSRSDGGRKAQSNGAGFERALEAMHAIYSVRGVYVVRLGAPTKRVGSGAGVKIIDTDKAPPDYLALSGDWSYLVEAKYTDAESWGLGLLKPHQATAFDRASLASRRTICGVVVQIGRVGAWWLPWRALRPAWVHWYATARVAAGEGALTPDDCDRVGRRLAGLDWMPAAGAMHLSP